MARLQTGSTRAFRGRHILFGLLSLTLCLAIARGQNLADGSDLTNFVTRPEIKSPLYDVEIYDEDALDEGYWFIGPYAYIFQSNPHPNLHLPCQTGPQIFDQSGELVWTGACAVENRVACDFRVFEVNGSEYMSMVFHPSNVDAKGHGLILDKNFGAVQRLMAPPGVLIFNMHELTYVNNGNRALYIVSRPMYKHMAGLLKQDESGWIVDLGLHEEDLVTGEITFQWWASDHIEVTESSAPVNQDNNPATSHDWLHINSVTKNEDGDYIMSARNTNCIYKISGKDGSILWRLGGTKSDFKLVDFDFSRQHDAQWLEYDDDVEVISFLDNGGDEFGYSTAAISSALIVRLEKTSKPPRATVLQKIDRPDGGKSTKRGNLQHLPNGNWFISWSDNSYFTEHAPDGRILMSARFRSERFVTYRAYKFPFEGGTPREPPRIHGMAYSAGKSSMTVIHASWNGQMNVASWRFWRASGSRTKADSIIGEVERTGFETSFVSEEYEARVYAEAIGYDGESLGKTATFAVEAPRVAQAAGTVEYDEKDEL